MVDCQRHCLIFKSTFTLTGHLNGITGHLVHLCSFSNSVHSVVSGFCCCAPSTSRFSILCILRCFSIWKIPEDQQFDVNINSRILRPLCSWFYTICCCVITGNLNKQIKATGVPIKHTCPKSDYFFFPWIEYVHCVCSLHQCDLA